MSAITQTQWIYEFSAGSREMPELLGGKGANVGDDADPGRGQATARLAGRLLGLVLACQPSR
jgi:hypothetical protein